MTNPQDRKTFVGNSIYGIIEQVFGQQFAGRITGMLIDEGVINFNTLLTDASYFTTKAYEAYNLLVSSQPQMVAAPVVSQ